MPAVERGRLIELDRRKRDVQLQVHLESHCIARAKIKGIGDSRKATLRSFGIETAWDISHSKVRSVPGFGESFTRTLLDWRSSVERRFVFNASRPTDPAAVAKVKDEIARRRNEIEQALRRGPTDLQQISRHPMSLRQSPGQPMIEAYRTLRQAEADAAS